MRSLLTTILDVAGMLLLVAAAAVWAATLEPGELVRGFGVAGVGLLVVSWVIDGAPVPWRKGST